MGASDYNLIELLDRIYLKRILLPDAAEMGGTK
jgi:hypothetical protein